MSHARAPDCFVGNNVSLFPPAPGLPDPCPLNIDLRVLAFTAGVSILTALFFGFRGHMDNRYRCAISLTVAKPTDILPGTLDLLILRTLELGPLHGVAIADRIQQVTRGVFLVGPGSLFPALHRLTEKGWIDGEWTESETKRRVKAYTLTASGRAQLAEEKRNWKNVFTAMNRALAEES